LTSNSSPPITLSAIALDPENILSGKTAQATIILNAVPLNDVTITLSSNDAAATVPESVTVAAGTTSATFIVTTNVVTAATQIVISASYGGLTRTATLNLSPPPSAKDTVAIQRAEYAAFSKQLRVQATSTDSNATLQVFTSTGKLLGTLTPDGGGRYSGTFISTSAPSSITVKSILGGSATKTVK